MQGQNYAKKSCDVLLKMRFIFFGGCSKQIKKTFEVVVIFTALLGKISSLRNTYLIFSVFMFIRFLNTCIIFIFWKT